MKVVRVAFVLMLLAAAGVRAQTNEDSIAGTWESDEKDIRMEYFQREITTAPGCSGETR